MVSTSVAMKLVTPSINSLTSLELDGTGLEHVPVDVTQGVLKIGLVRPPIYFPRDYCLRYYPLFILGQQENGVMVRLAEWGRRGSLVTSLKWCIAVVQSSFSPGSTRNVLMEIRHDLL